MKLRQLYKESDLRGVLRCRRAICSGQVTCGGSID